VFFRRSVLFTAQEIEEDWVHADHAKTRVATKVKQFLDDHNLRTASHPLYSPDLAASDFFLFGYVERLLQGANLQLRKSFSDRWSKS
jgi:hypothetical protein